MEPKDWPEGSQQSFLLTSKMGAAMSVAVTLIECMADQYGGRSGPWLDNLEKEVLSGFKNSDFSLGTSMQQEVFMMEPMLQTVRDIFTVARKNLSD